MIRPPPKSPPSPSPTLSQPDSGTKTAPQGTVGFSFTSQPAGSTASVTPCLLTANADGVSSSCTVMFSANTSSSYNTTELHTRSAIAFHPLLEGSDTITVPAPPPHTPALFFFNDPAPPEIPPLPLPDALPT